MSGRRVRGGLGCAIAVGAVLAVSACTFGGSNASPSVTTAASSPATTPTATDPPSTPPSGPPLTTLTKKLRQGDKGPAILALQRKLTQLGYWLGTPDGSFGGLTQQAVYALQKAAGLGRDGIVGVKTMAALNAEVRPTITSSGSGHRVEINKATQLLLIIDGTSITTILNTSTGSGANYLQSGHQEIALTPSGSFHVFRQIDGERIGPLGALWRPKYFNSGIAIHGLSSVPPYPASHGCARVSIAAMNWIWSTNQVPIGTSVTVV
jgi:peptidoglycan hydrolase-like protein with peptidoglycan-binding domain